MTTQRYQGKVAVVTGGNSGIGLGVAKAYAQEGAQVAITGRNENTLQAAAKEIGDGTIAIQSNAGDAAEIDAAMKKIKERFGRIDALFVNAGIAKLLPFDEITEEIFDETVDINMKGVFFTVQKAIPLMPKGSAIVLNGSINAHLGMPGTTVAVWCKQSSSGQYGEDVLRRVLGTRDSRERGQSGPNHLSTTARWSPGKNSRNESLDSKPSADETLWYAGGDCCGGALSNRARIRFCVGCRAHNRRRYGDALAA